ncbi:MAG: hypothetical protein LBR56_06470 [Sporomusaceae bacterium]|jgi:hypothetical protein|nr:hypothetical protein [Sporomusaceae bacterium]
MRNILPASMVTPVTAVLVAVLLLLSFTTPSRLFLSLYPLAREIVAFRIDYATRELTSIETGHFIIKYHPLDRETATMVAVSAEEAYEPVGQILNYRPREKALVIIYPDRAAMQKAYGWSSNNSAMGFYWGGVIQILSPRVWLADKNSESEFKQKGPMTHEYTHLVLDYLLKGNYPSWFTEGVAQYAEYKINAFEWITPNNFPAQNTYSLRELDKNFASLPNQSLAYRQSLAIVRYLVENYGENSFNTILLAMKQGVKIDIAIKNATGLNYREFEEKAKVWAEKTMNFKIIS